MLLQVSAVSCITWRDQLNARNGADYEEGMRHRQENGRSLEGGEGHKAKKDSAFKRNMERQIARINQAAWRRQLYEGTPNH